MLDVRRRDFITLLGGAVAAWPLAARGVPPNGGAAREGRGVVGDRGVPRGAPTDSGSHVFVEVKVKNYGCPTIIVLSIDEKSHHRAGLEAAPWRAAVPRYRAT